MARPSIVPAIQAVLEPHLESIHAEWLRSDREVPTLPSTGDKVNVRQLVRDLAGIDPIIVDSHEQHFYRKPELSSAVNRIAEEQGLRPIGSRSPEELGDAARRRLGSLSDQASDLRKVLAEREAVIEAQRREIAGLREQMRILEETGMVLRTGLLE